MLSVINNKTSILLGIFVYNMYMTAKILFQGILKISVHPKKWTNYHFISGQPTDPQINLGLIFLLYSMIHEKLS